MKYLIVAILFSFRLGLVYADCPTAPAKANDDSSFYIHKYEHTPPRLIVFVHGVTGNAFDTWCNTNNKKYFPSLLQEDDTFNSADIFVYNYPSPELENSYSIGELASNIQTVLSSNTNFNKYQEIIFIAHSLGGIVVRNYLLQSREIRSKTKALILLSTPMNGNAMANFFKTFSKNPQINELRKDGTYLAGLQQQWINEKILTPSYCFYEIQPILGFQVTRDSVTPLCNMELTAINKNHLEIAKPENDKDIVYISVKKVFNEIYPPSSGEENSEVLIANCTGSRKYSANLDNQLKDLIESTGKSSRISSPLPVDWNDNDSYISMLKKPVAPKLVVIHLSCFQEGDDTKESYIERTKDFVNFLKSLSNLPNIKILVYSHSFSGNSSFKKEISERLKNSNKVDENYIKNNIFHFAVPYDKTLGTDSEINEKFKNKITEILKSTNPKKINDVSK